jgi:hypothetical protein
MKAVEVLMEHGVPEERIIFINLVRILKLWLKLVTASHIYRYHHLRDSEPFVLSIHSCEWYG